MYLKKFSFRENAGHKTEWIIDQVHLAEINLVVGRNSSGKTRTLNALSDLVGMMKGRGSTAGGPVAYELEFENGDLDLRYELSYTPETVSEEKLFVGPDCVMDRAAEGRGKIRYAAAGEGVSLDFEIPHEQLATYAKRDRLQHPFIEELHAWAMGLRRFDFSGDLGKSSYALKTVFEDRELDQSDTAASQVPTISLALEAFPGFRTTVLGDMRQIGYELEDFGVMPFLERYAVYTTEAGLDKQVSQRDMSQGMFRAFSLLVQVNYYILKGKRGLVIIDDIGEGLDFTRATQLVQVLIRKAEAAGLQLLLSTNDSFIMNAVDIRHWAVIVREGHKISLFNYANSKEIFEEFKFTGLNNFDFYASEFFRSGLSGDDPFEGTGDPEEDHGHEPDPS